jgi:hypothetical protein
MGGRRRAERWIRLPLIGQWRRMWPAWRDSAKSLPVCSIRCFRCCDDGEPTCAGAPRAHRTMLAHAAPYPSQRNAPASVGGRVVPARTAGLSRAGHCRPVRSCAQSLRRIAAPPCVTGRATLMRTRAAWTSPQAYGREDLVRVASIAPGTKDPARDAAGDSCHLFAGPSAEPIRQSDRPARPRPEGTLPHSEHASRHRPDRSAPLPPSARRRISGRSLPAHPAPSPAPA